MPSPDIVYVHREDELAEELRCSLRSLRNFPHGRVWVAGYKPRWVKAAHIPTDQRRSKHINSTANLIAACRHPEVSDPFWLFNDDFFVLQPVEPKVWHRGTVAEVVADYENRLGGISPAMPYRRGMVETARLLERWGHTHPLSYELHLPMPVPKASADVLERAYVEGRTIPALHKRTVIGNVFHLGGDQMADVKVTDLETTWESGQEYVSTGNSAFHSGAVGRRLRELFADPSPFEEA